MSLQIRTFLPQDKKQILAMVTDFYSSPAFVHPIPVQHFADAFGEMTLDRGLYRGLAILDETGICGYCQLTFSMSTEAGGMVVWVEELYLAPACRGKGYGGKVLQFLKTEYAGRAARIRLEVTAANPRARALYEREGFALLNYTQMVLEDF